MRGIRMDMDTTTIMVTMPTLRAQTRMTRACESLGWGFMSILEWLLPKVLADTSSIQKRESQQLPAHIKVTSVRILRVQAEDCSSSDVRRLELTVHYSLTADAVHALTDLISDITTLATISWSLKPATTKYPMGYGKIESLGALAVSCILLGGGIGIGLQAVLALSQQFFPQIHEVLSHLGFLAHSHSHGHDHGHGHIDVGPNINAAWLAAGSIVVKEWLYRATMKIAKEKRSSVLSSNVSILKAF